MNNARKVRSPEEERLLNCITAGVFIVIGIPVVAVILGLSVRLFHIVAGS